MAERVVVAAESLAPPVRADDLRASPHEGGRAQPGRDWKSPVRPLGRLSDLLRAKGARTVGAPEGARHMRLSSTHLIVPVVTAGPSDSVRFFDQV